MAIATEVIEDNSNSISHPFGELLELKSILHDLANPLTLVQLNLDCISNKQKRCTKSQIVQMIQTAASGISAANKLILTLKSELSVPTDKQPYSAVEDLVNISQLYSQLLANHHIQLQLNFDDDKIFFKERTRFFRIISNVLTNSIEAHIESKATDTKYISISSRRTPKFLFVKISDNGPGISPEKLPKLFNNGYTSKVNHTGMGLAIALDYMQKHFGGSLNCYSKVKQGTTFELCFPAEQR